MVAPIDRLRWAAVLGGLFVALSAMVLLSLLGAGIGLWAYDPGESGRTYGIAAAIWGAITILVSFFLGGWFAARSAAVRGSNNGLMNGGMVWAVTIPILFFVLGGALGSVLGRHTDQVDRVIRASIRTDQPDQSARPGIDVRSQDTQQAMRTGRTAAWGALIVLLIGLGASFLGGYAGAREYVHEGVTTTTTRTPPTTTT